MEKKLYDPIMINDLSHENSIQFYQDKVSLIDTEEYSKFIYASESLFRHSRFYKDYKANIMATGLCYDQEMKAITSEMTDIEMHHHLPTLRDAAIIITESHFINQTPVNSFIVAKELEDCHRNNMMGLLMLTTSNHQAYTNDPNAFISIKQLYGNPLLFLEKYGPYFPLDIAFKWLLQFKQEEQYGNITTWYNIPVARQVLLNWSREFN